MVNELAPFVSSGDARTKMEFPDAMYLVRPPRFDGHGMPDEEVVHGLARLRQTTRGDKKREMTQHGLTPRIASNLRGVKEFQLSSREGTAASCLYAAPQL